MHDRLNPKNSCHVERSAAESKHPRLLVSRFKSKDIEYELIIPGWAAIPPERAQRSRGQRSVFLKDGGRGRNRT
jgi:hypothetical protein